MFSLWSTFGRSQRQSPLGPSENSIADIESLEKAGQDHDYNVDPSSAANDTDLPREPDSSLVTEIFNGNRGEPLPQEIGQETNLVSQLKSKTIRLERDNLALNERLKTKLREAKLTPEEVASPVGSGPKLSKMSGLQGMLDEKGMPDDIFNDKLMHKINKMKLDIYLTRCNVAFAREQYRSMEFYADTAIRLSRKFHDPPLTAFCQYHRGIAQYYQGHFSEAYESFNASTKAKTDERYEDAQIDFWLAKSEAVSSATPSSATTPFSALSRYFPNPSPFRKSITPSPRTSSRSLGVSLAPLENHFAINRHSSSTLPDIPELSPSPPQLDGASDPKPRRRTHSSSLNLSQTRSLSPNEAASQDAVYHSMRHRAHSDIGPTHLNSPRNNVPNTRLPGSFLSDLPTSPTSDSTISPPRLNKALPPLRTTGGRAEGFGRSIQDVMDIDVPRSGDLAESRKEGGWSSARRESARGGELMDVPDSAMDSAKERDILAMFGSGRPDGGSGKG